jgi:hypothetical protein
MHEKPSNEENALWLKISPRLFTEVCLVKGTEKVIPVMIECVGDPTPPCRTPVNESFEFLIKEMDRLQKPVIDELESLGIDPESIEKHALANSISLNLTAGNILTIAELPEVKMIEFDGSDNLTK